MDNNNLDAQKDIDAKKEIEKLQGEEVEDAVDNTANEDENSIWKKKEAAKQVLEKKNPVEYAVKPEQTSKQILSIDPDDYVVDGQRTALDELFHDLKTAKLKKKKLHGTIDEVGRTPKGMPIVATYYKGQRIIIPMKEMALILSDDKKFIDDKESRQIQMANNMIGAEIDFVIKDVQKDGNLILAVASRKEAVLDKIKTYYGELDADRTSMVARQPLVEGRITAVNRKNLWVEVLGIQTQINAMNVFWEWVVDLKKSFSPGDKLLVNVKEIEYPDPKDFKDYINNEEWLLEIKIKAEHKSFEPNLPSINFNAILPKTKCRAVVTDYHNGVYFLQLASKVNAIAHSLAGNRKVLVGDTVSFLCQRKDEDTTTAIGYITKVINSEYGM